MVGGGIAGITAAIKVANAGYPVYMVEKEEIIGGRMAQFDKTFPTMDCAGCTLTPKTSEVGRHPNIEILTKSEIQEVAAASSGNFKVRVRQQPRYVSTEKCTGCGDCQQVCPVNLASSFEVGLATRHPISRPFPQAIPNNFAIIRDGIASLPVGLSGRGQRPGLHDPGRRRGNSPRPWPWCASACPLPRPAAASACVPAKPPANGARSDTPLAICQTKRFLGDYEVDQGVETPAHPRGSGPSVSPSWGPAPAA